MSGELGANYAAGVKVAGFTNPFPAGISLGASAFAAPFTGFPNLCGAPCNLSPFVFRWMAEARLGSAYSDHARGLAWLGLSAGVAYATEPRVDPSPSASVAAGGDVRITPGLWLELSPRVTWADLLGSKSTFAGSYFTVGVDVGLRLDLGTY